MPSRPENRAIHVLINLRPKEYEKALSDFKKTTCRTITEYVRRLVLRKPITTYYRDQSFDEFTEVVIQLKKKLDSLTTTDKLSVEQKACLKEQISGIKELFIKIYDHVRNNQKIKRP